MTLLDTSIARLDGTPTTLPWGIRIDCAHRLQDVYPCSTFPLARRPETTDLSVFDGIANPTPTLPPPVFPVSICETRLGETPTRYLIPWAAYAAFGWLLFNVGLVMLAVRRVRNLRFAPERRASVRWETDLVGDIGIQSCRFVDLSLTGARITVEGEFGPLIGVAA